MFLRRDYGDRALGLVGALAVLIIGLLVTGALSAAPDLVTTADATQAIDLTQAEFCDVVC